MRGRRLDRIGQPGPDDSVLSAIKGDVERLRLTLASDLSVAAAAVDNSEERIAGDIVDADRREMAEFAERTLQRLGQDRSRKRATTSPRKALVRVGPALLAAACAAAVLVSSVPSPATRPAVSPISTVTRSLAAFRDAVLQQTGDTSAVMNAAARLRASIASLLLQARDNPATASQLVQVLRTEEDLLLAVRPSGTAFLLPEVTQLLAQLSRSAVPASHAAQPVLPTPPPMPGPAPVTAPRAPQPSTSTAKSPYPASSSSPGATSTAKPSPSPSPSASSTSSGGVSFNPTTSIPVGGGLPSPK